MVKRPARRLLQHQVRDDGGLNWDGGSGGELRFWIYYEGRVLKVDSMWVREREELRRSPRFLN